jgi:chromosome partitioning protein
VDPAGAELELASAAREFRLRNALATIAAAYDYILIDCPPSLNLLTVNALTAATGVLVPLQCEYYALEGLSQLLKTVELVKQNLNSNLEIEGVVLTLYDRRNNLCDMVAADVRRHFGAKVFDTVIPRNVRLSRPLPRQAGAALRSALLGLAGLYPARRRAAAPPPAGQRAW